MSSVALAMRHRYSGISTYRLNGLRHGCLGIVFWNMAHFTQYGVATATVNDPAKFVCLFAWGLTALSAQIGYIAP